jgi:hypothetical protein
MKKTKYIKNEFNHMKMRSELIIESQDNDELFFQRLEDINTRIKVN